jgi:hypothetical protein
VTLRQNGVDTGAMELDGVDDTIVDGIVVDDGTGVTEESLVADNVSADDDDVEEAAGELIPVLDNVELIVMLDVEAMVADSVVTDNVSADDDVEEAAGELMLVLDAVELIAVSVAGAMMDGVVELDNVLVVSVDDIVDDMLDD